MTGEIQKLLSDNIRSTIILSLHGLLLFGFGVVLSLNFMTFPLWITGLLVMLWVPKNLWGIGRQLRAPDTSQFVRLILAKRFILVVLLSLPYIIPPGFLFCYPLSDLGFRLLIGNRLQAHAVEFLKTPTSRMPRRGPNSTLLKRGSLPPSMWTWALSEPNIVMVRGTKPEDRHLALIYGGGFGHWGLLIGETTFRADKFQSDDYLRQMWPGVYHYTEFQ